MRKALAYARKCGFSTVKEYGIWYISKPYHRASYLIEVDGKIKVGYRNPMGSDFYEPLESLAA